MAKTSTYPFIKMTGGGNDFVLFDNRKEQLNRDYGVLARRVCDRKFSIGADGILVLEKDDQADFRMVYFNSDGSRAEMCGNGARCIARFAHLLKAAQQKMNFMTDAGLLSAEVKEQSVKLKMSLPKDLKLDFTAKLEDGKEFSLSFINTGVPHSVMMVNDIEKVDVEALGKAIRFHKEFAPAGTNVNFVQQRDNHLLSVRTYERGVEGETLACGTGVVAASLICAAQNKVQSPVSCLTRGGEVLKVYFSYDIESNSFVDVYLEGPATVCFRGEIDI